ncbi:hypothetical protein HPB47_027517 [Ixodes persulcatus]|uniref:Uncharacterized protein n=1 Tax=Ixodes persulcatus TaxID=34615 RepID=A0AC60PVN1_IXOPE|nr:hypothetical protein HPB47_027517 [Ixodes persulcatus]
MKESIVTLMKRHAKSLSHETWSDFNKNVNEIGDALTLVSMEVAHLQGKVDQLQEQQVRGVPGTYASALAAAGALAGPSVAPTGGAVLPQVDPEPVQDSRETLLVYGKPEVNTWAALTTRFDQVTCNIQNVSVKNIAANGVSVQASNRVGAPVFAALRSRSLSPFRLTPHEPVERSRLRLLQEIRSLTGRQTPRTHGGTELWILARLALDEVEVAAPLNNYIRECFFRDVRPAPPHRQRRPQRPLSRREQKKDYALAQELFRKRQSECARDILDGKAAAEVEDPETFLKEWESIMAGSVPPPIPEKLSVIGAALDPF